MPLKCAKDAVNISWYVCKSMLCGMSCSHYVSWTGRKLSSSVCVAKASWNYDSNGTSVIPELDIPYDGFYSCCANFVLRCIQNPHELIQVLLQQPRLPLAIHYDLQNTS